MTQDMTGRFLAARQQYIRNQFSKMNPRQMEAVMTTRGPLLLLAGAGSGKTTVLIHRIANLIRFGEGADSPEVPQWLTEEQVLSLERAAAHPEREEDLDALCAVRPVRPWQIIAITFTNKAANELKNRLADMLGPEGEDVWAMTFHSACCRILRREIGRLGYTSSFTIYDTADSERVIKDVLRDMSLDEKVFPPRMCLNLISKAKDQMQTPEEFTDQAGSDFRLQRIGSIYGEYQKRLVGANALDFDDIILCTVRLLQEYEEVRLEYQKRFRYVLIDEYQDTNHLQYLLASLLAGGHGNICVVGDDDQSIYRFRGATIENILEFENQYQGAKTIRLEQNYRSTQSILDAANGVIAHNRGRKGKHLWTNNGPGEKLLCYTASSESAEAAFVADQILSQSGGKGFKDYAILYRTNAQSNPLEVAFKRSGVPYRIIGGTRFFDRAEVKDMLAYLWVINNRADDLRLKRIINQPPRGIGGKTVENIERICATAGMPLYSVVCDPYSYPAMERSAQKLLQFTALIETCAELLQTLSLPEFYEELLVRSGYAAMLEQKNDVESRNRLENVRELKSSLVTYSENAEEPTLGGFLEEIALYTDIDQYDTEADAVAMMTMHSAKGLEFPNVFIVGAEENLFPGSRCIGDEAEMEEERRLCYVALTRAKKQLTITGARQRMLYGRTMVNRRSRFVDEIPPELLIEKEEFARNYSYGAESGGTGFGTAYGQNHSRHDNWLSRRSSDSAASGTANRAPLPQLRKGDMVHHDTFGGGMVLSVVPMGNDAMLEIAFDQVGTKRLMARAAAARLRKTE